MVENKTLVPDPVDPVPAVPASGGRFAADVTKLVSGTVLAQAISFLAAPLMARLFSPGAFGLASVFISITSLLGVIVCLRYDRSVIVPADDSDAINLLALSILCTAAITTLVTPFLWLGKTFILGRLHAPEMSGFYWLVPVNLFLLGVLAALNAWGTRKAQFTLVTVAQTLSSVAYIGLAIASGLLGRRGGNALIVATVAGAFISAFLLLVCIWQQLQPSLLAAVSLARIKEVLVRYQRFPKFSSAAAVLNSLSWELPTFFLSGFFSTAVVGQYALGNRLIRLPMSLLGINISRVLAQRTAEARHQGTLAPLVESAFQSLLTLGMFPFLMMGLVGKELFTIVFGARWADAGLYSQILSVWAFFWFISAPLTCIVDILEEQAFDLRMNIAIVVSRCLALLIGGLMGSPVIALAIFSIVGVSMYAYYCIAILHKAGLPRTRPLRMLASQFVAFAPYGALIIAARWWGASRLVILAISGVAITVHYALILRSEPAARMILHRLLPRRFAKLAV